MGFFGAGNFGIVPGYLTERFPTAARAAAPVSRITPARASDLLRRRSSAAEDRGLPLATAMASCIAGSGVMVILMLGWGPKRAVGSSTRPIDRA